MTWILGILAAIAALIFGMYQVGPGLNRRKEKKQQADWLRKWQNLQDGNKK